MNITYCSRLMKSRISDYCANAATNDLQTAFVSSPNSYIAVITCEGIS
ncbi:hypothetical protein GFS31_42800 (plasmid) [Leptolyngbya sp. BL0902]|nr:hypothetical protein GFS31_42800 [Leptolyngbya sp. BL0902]